VKSKYARQGAKLSPRETEVLACLGEGRTLMEIARLKELSAKTVQMYCARLKTKLGLGNINQLIRLGALKNTPQIADAITSLLDRTESIEVRYFDGDGKLLNKRRFTVY
jgi:DNA-binding CsgD family transcriptional regulator